MNIHRIAGAVAAAALFLTMSLPASAQAQGAQAQGAQASCHTYQHGVGTTSAGYPNGWSRWTCNSPAHQLRAKVKCQYASVADLSYGPTETALFTRSSALCGKTGKVVRAWTGTRPGPGFTWTYVKYYG